MAEFIALKTNEGEIRTVEKGSSLYNDIIAEGGSGFVPALNQTVSEDGQTNETPSIVTRPFTNSVSGRYYLYNDSRWVTDSDDNFGTGYFYFFESGGNGPEPIYEWEHLGEFYKAGSKVVDFSFVGRCSSPLLKGMEIRLVAKSPKDPNTWATGFNNDSKVDIQTIYSGTYEEMGVTASSLNTMTRGSVSLDVTLEKDSLICMYVRRSNTTTNSTLYFTGTRSIGVISNGE